MKKPSGISRRSFVIKAGAGTAATLLWPFSTACENSGNSKPGPDPDFRPDIELNLNAVQRERSLLPGNNTKLWLFEAELVNGDRNALETLEKSYPGPVIKVRKGQKIRIRFKNELPEESIVHWHGMHVPEAYDGHPKDVIQNGETYIYEFTVMNRAGTYWFHPHPHGRTGPQVYNGLAGMLLVSDEEEEKLGLPPGEFDLPVVIQDRSFDENNQLVYLRNDRERMHGFLGDQILINGDPSQSLELKAGCAYRLRLVNGSNSRIYKLSWGLEKPLTIIGKDGSLLSAPRQLPYLMLGPGERCDLWLDLRNASQGEELEMNSLSFPAGHMASGMMGHGGMMSAETELPNGSFYKVLDIKVLGTGSNTCELPESLAIFNPIDPSEARNLNNPRTFTFAMDHMQWTINGRTWETTGVSGEEQVQLNTTEVWELINGNGMMGGRGMHGGGMMGGEMTEEGMGAGGMQMMQMSHPVHIHQLQFNVLERNVEDMDPEIWNAVKEGFINEGWQDTVLLIPGMRIKVIMQFRDFKGKFVYHCHNLEHEDLGMMRNFEIT